MTCFWVLSGLPPLFLADIVRGPTEDLDTRHPYFSRQCVRVNDLIPSLLGAGETPGFVVLGSLILVLCGGKCFGTRRPYLFEIVWG